MSIAQKFYQQLGQVLALNAGLRYSSESDYPLEVAWLDHVRDDVFGWESEAEMPDDLLAMQTMMWTDMMGLLRPDDVGEATLPLGQWLVLRGLFSEMGDYVQCAYKRPTQEACVFDLYLLVRIRGKWIGLKTRIIET